MDKGASPSGDRAFAPSASSQQAVSPVPASIPSAMTVLIMAVVGVVLCFAAIALCAALHLPALVAGVAGAFAAWAWAVAAGWRFASAIEARRAATGTGAVHESAAPSGETPNA